MGIVYEQSNNITDVFLAQKMLAGLNNYYPDFGYWFINKCVPGILIPNSSDKLILAKDGTKIVGLVLGKKTKEETKLRCVRVIPEYKNKGTGIVLIEKILKELDNDKPHCTVAEELIHDYSRVLVNRFDFNLTKVNKGMYRQNKLEYIFN